MRVWRYRMLVGLSRTLTCKIAGGNSSGSVLWDTSFFVVLTLFSYLSVWPLAVLDYTSVDCARDLIASDNVYQHQVSQTYNVFFNSSHRWFYLSGHQPHELLLFKAYDSKTKPGTARGNRRCTLSHEKALLMIYSALMRHLIIHLLLQIVAVERALNALAWFYILKGV